MTKFWNIKNEAGEVAELLIYGDIYDGWFSDTDSKQFAQALKSITANEIRVRINSYGGEVFGAQAIYSSLKNHPARVVVHIDGIAASAATIIAMAGDYVVMPENAMMMIHNPLVATVGDAEELRETADVLDKVRDSIVAVYRGKTGLSDEKLVELMADETWMTAKEAKELGFVDEVAPAMKIAARARKDGAIIINGLTLDSHRRSRLPEGWLARVEVEDEETPAVETPGEEVGNMTLEELKEKHPEIVNAIVEAARAEGAAKERERIRAIEAVALPGHEALVARAKFEEALTPEAFAIEVIKAEKARKEQMIEARAKDAAPLASIAPSVVPVANAEEKRAPVVNAMAAAFSRKNGQAAN